MDESILKKAIEGDTVAFDCLLVDYRAMIRRVCWHYMGNLQDMEDAQIESESNLWLSLEKYTNGTFEGYVYTIVKNTCLGMLEQRNAQKRGYGLVDSLDAMKDQETMENRREFPDPGSGPEDQIIQKEAVTQLKQCIRALPKEQQDAVRLTQLMQYSYKEASVMLNISEGTLKSRINRGMNQLKTKMWRWLSGPDPLDAKNEKIT